MADMPATMDEKPDLYSDDDMPDQSEAKDEGGHDEEMEQSDSEEAKLPLSILAGKKFDVGDEVVLKITGMHDNEITVKYAPAKEGDEKEGEDGEEAPMPASMDKGGGGYYD